MTVKKKVALGLSGGVDSAVAAVLLREKGYEVTGIFMVCYQGPGCRTDRDRKDALDTALELGIPFEVIDFRQEYEEKVLKYFLAEYEAGRTPNPDVRCNREIKFGMFYREMIQKRGFDYIATGHYARIECSRQPDLDVLAACHKMAASGCARQSRVCRLLQSIDRNKDQTYFLHQLREEQLGHILFPVGGMTKDEVREEALKRNLPTAKKPDSQGICFVGEVSISKMLKQMGITEKAGEVVDVGGKVLGRHRGVWFYTIGQRHGFEIKNQSAKAQALYVLDKEVGKNRLIVGSRDQCKKGKFEVDKVNWIGELPVMGNGLQVKVRVRHLGELVKAKVERQKAKLLVKLEKPVFGVASGQSAVFYEGEVVLGGGIIV